MWDYVKLIALGVIAVLAAIGANYARDPAYLVNALTIMLVAGALFLWSVRHVGEAEGRCITRTNILTVLCAQA